MTTVTVNSVIIFINTVGTQNPSIVLEHRHGEKLYIDYAGEKLSYIDRDTGEEIFGPVFVACLPY